MPTIVSDQADYSPGATVRLTGGGWVGAVDSTPAESVHIVVNDTIGQTWSHDATVTPDANGNIEDVFQLPSYFVSNYDVTATGTLSGTATTTFTDQVAANLDQCQNKTLAFLGDPCGTAPAGDHPTWDNGNVNGSNSQYREGDGLPYRSSITGLTNGTWTIRVEYDFSKGGVPAIDRLTRYNLTQASNPCLSTIDVTCTVSNPVFSFEAPSEVVSPSATQPALPNSGNLHTWGGSNGLASVLLNSKADGKNMFVWNENASCTVAFSGAGQDWTGNLATSFDDGKVLQDGSAAGDSERQFAFKVAVSGCAQGTDLMMGWSGHIASHLDWGTFPNKGGAGSISGSPFHMRILGVDNAQGTSGGNQDRSVQLSAIVQTLEVRKALSPVGSGTFDLQIDNATKAAAVGDGGTTGPVAVTAGNHSVGELGANLPSFSKSIACEDSSGNPVASNSGSASLSPVNVPVGDSVVCTITNTLLKSHLTLVKQVTNDNGGTAEADDWTLNASGPTPISGASGSPAVTNAEVNSGSYALSETSGPSGYTASAWVCVGGTQNGSDISLAPGQDATCTITNNDNAPKLTLNKVVVNDNGGTALESAWTLTATGNPATVPPTLSGPGAAGGADVVSGAGFDAGSYDLSESGPANYSASDWSCSGGQVGTQAKVSVALGDDITCTITNNDIPPQLKLRKIVVNDNGGTALNTAWTLTANGDGDNDVSGSTPVDSGASLQAGSFALSESGPAGYSPGAGYSCVGGTQTGQSVAVGIGESATCTITNNDKPGHARVIKTVSGQPIPVGPACTTPGPTCFLFQLRDEASMTQSGTTLESVYAGGTNGGTINFTTNLSANHTYQLCEVVMPGWSTSLGSFVPSSFMPPDGVAPNPGVDNSILCINFTVGLDETFEITVENTPPPGGRALTIGFWKNWASCANSNGKGQKPVLDQTLAAASVIPAQYSPLPVFPAGPGIVVSATSGVFDLFGPTRYLVLHGSTTTPNAAPGCLKAVNLLNKMTIDGKKKKASDAAFNMAAQLVAAELNYVAGAGKFPDVTTNINRAVLLLGMYKFNGLTYTPTSISVADTATMNCLAKALDDYNNNRIPRTQCP